MPDRIYPWHRRADGGFVDVMWVGAEHMLTGYDHLLFLFGAVLVLVKASRVLAFVTAFTVGHTITLLGATLLGVRANPYLIDAAIALTVLYVALQNMGLLAKWACVFPTSCSWSSSSVSCSCSRQREEAYDRNVYGGGGNLNGTLAFRDETISYSVGVETRVDRVPVP